ncbi:hypothetical protein HMPREF1977_1597 [Capnocytophaga ochracea F0287]|uniref:Uncharacterized protein n=1 Tax=Capnocytophaga ochracea F0287 TaxID=873517 RepID=E4MT87_CAPOC|nr:hypothetical protein HMPREF1977_1597 [Capnocytophaga ochracea F0287]
MDFNFAKVLKLWQSSYKKRCEPHGQVVNERRKGEGNTLETSPFTHTQLSLATSKGGMWRYKGEGKGDLNTVLFVSF